MREDILDRIETRYGSIARELFATYWNQPQITATDLSSITKTSPQAVRKWLKLLYGSARQPRSLARCSLGHPFEKYLPQVERLGKSVYNFKGKRLVFRRLTFVKRNGYLYWACTISPSQKADLIFTRVENKSYLIPIKYKQSNLHYFKSLEPFLYNGE